MKELNINEIEQVNGGNRASDYAINGAVIGIAAASVVALAFAAPEILATGALCASGMAIIGFAEDYFYPEPSFTEA
ncbi:hypothetical protein [Shewanella surugensis]|uniref:Class IIb bacteriocin, lactobin A/cerein 7B family n=1 Tax=Shewanella surugensis TaxID=212020 RepID=A0ABT0LC47_9GAMM|nr:hypothetical protein [Shewanella surugensis]MCL1125085.1 hypothetical protein [Shewanella surugensis]